MYKNELDNAIKSGKVSNSFVFFGESEFLIDMYTKMLSNIEDASRNAYLEIIARMEQEDMIGGVILGCTEIGMLISQQDLELPVFDTTEIHALAAVEEALPSSTILNI